MEYRKRLRGDIPINTQEWLKQRIFHFFRERDYLYEGLQRTWEYAWVCDRLPECANSVLFDTGCGEEGRFAKFLHEARYQVFCNDIGKPEFNDREGLTYLQGTTQYVIHNEFPAWHSEFLSKIDCVTCISVLEHVEDKEGFCKALDSIPAKILITLEFVREDSPMREALVDLETLTDCLSCFTNHYISEMAECPVYAFNSSSGQWRPLAIELLPNGKEK